MPPLYDYHCPSCNATVERNVAFTDRDTQRHLCGAKLFRQLSAPMFKFAGVAAKGGGPDRFTADMLGIPLKELPEGLKTK
jgi:putative FmdB family regulatory protein